MGASERRKGVVGRQRAKNLLLDRDWSMEPTMDGIKADDLVVIDPNGQKWSVEVKNTKLIAVHHRQQAQLQAQRRDLPWMLMSRIFGTGSWLTQRQGELPVCWHEK
jgi:hypothetical protein